MADAESVKTALTELRDVAENQANAEKADLRPVAEAYQKFNNEWVSLREEEIRNEQNPDEDPANAGEIAERQAEVDAQENVQEANTLPAPENPDGPTDAEREADANAQQSRVVEADEKVVEPAPTKSTARTAKK